MERTIESNLLWIESKNSRKEEKLDKMPSTTQEISIDLHPDAALKDCKNEVLLPTIKIEDFKSFYQKSVKLGEKSRFNLIFMVCSKPFETSSCGKMSIWVEDIEGKGIKISFR